MNDKLLCPFCQQELKYDSWNEVYVCRNPNCKHLLGFGTKELWQALIDTKKKLDIAVDALKIARDCSGVYSIECLAKDTLEQINGKEKPCTKCSET